MFAHHLDDNNNLAAIMMLVVVQIKFVQFRYNTFCLFVRFFSFCLLAVLFLKLGCKQVRIMRMLCVTKDF